MTSLTGTVVSSGLSLDGTGDIRFSVRQEDIDSFRKLKLYLIENFMEPLIYKELENVNLNLYNFSFILNNLNKFRNIDSKEVDLYRRIVEFVQQTVATYNTTASLKKQVYGTNDYATFINDLPLIILKAEYEVYNALYGKPEKFTYNKKIIREIKLILQQYPGILIKDIEKIIDYRLKDTIIYKKMKKNAKHDNDGKLIKLEYTLYKKLFKLQNEKYNEEILEILKKVIEDYPTYTLLDIKKHIYENHRIYSYLLLDDIYEKPVTIEDRYDALFGKPVKGNFYKKNYIKLIEEILQQHPYISNDDLAIEFEFRQPIWAELLLKNQTINALLYKDSRFRVNVPINVPDRRIIKNNSDVIIEPDDPDYIVTKKDFDDGDGRKPITRNYYVDNTTYTIFKTNEKIRNNYI